MANNNFTEVKVFIDEDGNRVEIPVEKGNKMREFANSVKEKTQSVVKTIIDHPIASVIVLSTVISGACRIVETRNTSKRAEAMLVDARRREEEYYDRKRRREEKDN